MGGVRTGKDDLRVECYGTIDELNSVLGMAVVHFGRGDGLCQDIVQVQHHLFRLGAQLADPDGKAKNDPIGKDEVRFLEERIDSYEESLDTLKQFILPGGAAGGAALHHARAVCRRAERLTVGLNRASGPLPDQIIPYLNRLSDYLFVAARFANHSAGAEEVKWDPKV